MNIAQICRNNCRDASIVDSRLKDKWSKKHPKATNQKLSLHMGDWPMQGPPT